MLIKRVSLALAALCLSAAAFAVPVQSPESGYQAAHIAAPAAFPSDVDAGALRVAMVDTFANPEVIPMSVRALFRCTSIKESTHRNPDGSDTTAASVSFSPPYVADVNARGPELELFGKYTPSGQITMFVTNEAAWRQWEVGKDYYVDWNPVPAGA